MWFHVRTTNPFIVYPDSPSFASYVHGRTWQSKHMNPGSANTLYLRIPIHGLVTFSQQATARVWILSGSRVRRAEAGSDLDVNGSLFLVSWS